MLPRSGDVLRITRAASVQFTTPVLFRVIRVHDWTTYHGWAWLDGYELNAAGEAVERRSIFVQLAGLQRVVAPHAAPDPMPNRYRAPRQHRPARVPAAGSPLPQPARAAAH